MKDEQERRKEKFKESIIKEDNKGRKEGKKELYQ